MPLHENKFHWFDAMLKEKNTLWFFSNGFNGLFEADLRDDNVTFLGSVPDEDAFAECLYFNMLKDEDKLYLIPSCAKNLAIFDLKKKIFETVFVDMPVSKCFGATIHDKKIYMFGNSSARIAVFDMESKSINYLDDCKEYYKTHKHQNHMYFRRNVIQTKDSLVVPACASNTVFRYNFTTERMEAFTVGNGEDRFISATYDGEDFWLALWGKAEIIRWNEKDGLKARYVCPLVGRYNTGDMICVGERIWLLPISDSDIIFYSINSNEWGKCTALEKYNCLDSPKLNKWGQSFPMVIKDKLVMWIFASNCRKLLEYYWKEEKVIEHAFEFTSEDIGQFVFENKVKILDEEMISLSDYIQLVCKWS